ncbi:hypothetical protein BRC82_01440 [Halobacteriales archaeon QS_1_67_19]|nr:MAG: hypothetical protein BRC82_01440 [Halobacteriales archaeon QS_1_67_19]
MSEKNIDTSSEKITEKQTVDRRTYLKLAGAAGSGLGAGVGTGVLGTEFSTPVSAESGTVVDDFTYSSGGLSDRYVFDQDAGNATVATASTVGSSDDDSNVLEITDGTSVLHAYKGDGDTDLNAYPEIGDTFSCWIRETNGTGMMNFIYGAKDKDNKYYVQLNLTNAHLGLFKYVNGSGSSLAGDWSNSTIENNTGWFEVEIQWTTDHQHTVTLYQDGSEVTSFSYTEDSNDPKFTANGVGFAGHLESGETAQFDYATTTSDTSSGFRQSNVDNFEKPDLNLDAYDFDRGESGAEIVADSETGGTTEFGPTYSGSRALKISDSSATEMISLPGDGLDDYPEAGDTFRCYVKATSGADNFNLTWGVQGHADRYYVKVKPESDGMYLFKYKNNDGTVLASTSGLSMNQDEWYYLEVEWKTDGAQTVELYDLDGNTLAECTGTDSEWSTGGIGFDAYLNSGEAIHFDEFYIVKEHGDYIGGWGPEHIWRYHSEGTGDPDWDEIEDFHYFLNYSGYRPVYNNDGNLDAIEHGFMISSFSETYLKDTAFETDPQPEELDVAAGIDANKITIDVDTSNQSPKEFSVPNNRTRASGLTGPDWGQWKNDSSNFDEETDFNEFKEKAKEEGVLPEEASDYIYKSLYFAFNVWVAFNVGAGASVGIKALELLADTAYDPPVNCDLSRTEDSYYDAIEWDYCDPMSLTDCHRFFEIELEPGAGDVKVTVEQENHHSGRGSFDGDNVCQWNLTLPDAKENATWSAETRNEDI